MELKYFFKSKLSLKKSEDYLKLSPPPPNTCPLIDELKKHLSPLNSDPSLKFFLETIEDYRASCDSIRKEVKMAKDSLWFFIDDIFEVDFENQIFKVKDEAKTEFMTWTVDPYTEAETGKLDQSSKKLLENKPELAILIETELPLIKGNIFKLNEWRTEYFSIINQNKKMIYQKILFDLKEMGFKEVS